MSFSSMLKNSKTSKRVLVLCTFILFIFISCLFNIYTKITELPSCNNNNQLLPSFSLSINNIHKKHQFINLNSITSSATSATKNKEKLLVLTPLKDAGLYLDRYFELLDRTTYPNHLISLAFLVSDSSDDTIASLESHIQQIQSRPFWRGKDRFESVRIFKKDFKFDLPSEQRHRYESQPLRRSIMAKSRNWLLTAAIRPDHSWVAWVDVDVVEYPDTIFEDLMRADVDVVVPNCLLKREDHEFWAYDKNNWQETENSWKIQEGLDPDFVLLEGYYEFPTYRYLMVDMPTEVGLDYKVPLDGVGATFTLVKAHVHREGALFPPYPFAHQLETEGFAKIAKAMGFSVYGLPGYIIYHVQNH